MANPIDLFEDDNVIIPGAEAAPELKDKPSSEKMGFKRRKLTPEPKQELPKP